MLGTLLKGRASATVWLFFCNGFQFFLKTGRESAFLRVLTVDMPTSLEHSKLEFINCWGEMASHWGVSKTMAQIYALLYVSTEPMDTEGVMEQLSISRGNANINLHKLLDWNIIRKVEQEGTRRDFFVAEKDVWELSYHIVQERRQREVLPLLDRIGQIESAVKRTAEESERDLNEKELEFIGNVQQMSEFLQLLEGMAQKFVPLLKDKQLLQLSELLNMFAKVS